MKEITNKAERIDTLNGMNIPALGKKKIAVMQKDIYSRIKRVQGRHFPGRYLLSLVI
jgi:hypothetical protein